MGNDINFETPNKKFKKPKSFLMAYSLNNHQPVQCTMISDQPFFYMDEEISFDDDALLDDENFSETFYALDEAEPNILESELLALKNKIDAYERVSLEFSRNEDEIQKQFLMDSHVITKGSVEIDPDMVLSRILKTLNQSRYAQTLLEFAAKNGIKVELSDQVETAAYDKKAGKIFVRADIDLDDQILLVVQELRRHWQHHQGALVHPLTFHPDQAVLINRAQLADLSVAVIRSAWELKLNGHASLWRRIENSPLSDLGRALAREALSDFRTLNNGKAASAVFETWFLSERCRQQDKKLIQAMLADYRGYVFDSTEASRMVSIDLICALGEQPYGKNYLAPYAQMIMNDPIFTDVRDRSNANFLWFIKFEREFSETEQELQSSNLIKESGIQQTYNNDIIEDTNHEEYFSAAAKEDLRQSIFGGKNQSEGNNVVHVHFGKNRQPREGVLS